MKPPPIPPLAKKVVVEPLDPDRLTRIERAVVSRAVDAAPARAPRSWIGLAAAVGATAVAAAAVGWLAHGRTDRAPTDAAAPIAAADTAPIRVHTDAQAATLDIGDASIASGPDTAFVVTRPGGGVLVDMARGQVELEVGKRGARPPLVVRAGDTDVIVIGTHFLVDYGDGHGDVDVRVREGRVRIVRQEHETFVAAGQQWTSRGGLVAIADVATDAGPAAVIGDVPATGRGSGVVIALHPAPKVLHDRVAVVPEVHRATPAMPAVSSESPDTVIGPHGEHMTPGAATLLKDASDPHTAIYAGIRGVAMRPPMEAHPTGAQTPAEYYRAVAFGPAGDSSADALYSLAYVQERAQKLDDAQTTIDAYLPRFTHGEHRGAVLWLEVRIHCLDRKWDTSCHAAAQTYLDQAPNGAGAHVAELITQSD